MPPTETARPAATATEFGDLDAEFAAMLAALGGHPQATVAMRRDEMLPAEAGFADIHAAFAALRKALALPEAGHGRHPGYQTGGDRPAVRLDKTVAEARAAAGWYAGAPEWQRITRVSTAARALTMAIRETATDYWAEVSQDIRVRGFARTVATRVTAAIAGGAGALASRLENSGRAQSRAWRAAHELSQASAGLSKGLMTHPPADGARMRDVERIVADLSLPRQAHPGHVSPGRPAGGVLSAAQAAQAGFPRLLARTAVRRPGPARTARCPAPASTGRHRRTR